ncbi:7TM-DISM domain-containing protein [Bermanella marisrubri]|nr:7TM-DISM domain-containing protein [Bermanella marisrubri]QIZ83393.1 7TM-DISM domain-containing protein [Bermanella marisrubri]
MNSLQAKPETVIDAQALEQGPVELDGFWALDWRVLHTDFQQTIHDGIVLPGLWHKQGPYDRFGFATLRHRAVLPKLQSYHLLVPDAPSAISVWVNGQNLFQRGQVARTQDNESPKFGPEVIKLPPAKEYEIILHVSNFHHKDGGVFHSIQIATDAHHHELLESRKFVTIMTFTLLMTLSIFLLISGLQRSWNKVHWFFSTFIWCIAFRSVLVGDRVAYTWLSDLDWVILQRIEHILLFMALPLFLYYFQTFFRLRNHWFAHVVSIMSLVISLITLFAPAHVFTYFGPVAQAMGLCSVIYIVVTCVLLIRNKTPYSILFLSSFIVLAVVVIHDYIYTHLWINSQPLAHFGLMAFIIMQSYLLWLQRRQENRLMHYVKTILDERSIQIKNRIQDISHVYESCLSQVKHALDNNGYEAISSELISNIQQPERTMLMSELDDQYPLDELLAKVRHYYYLSGINIEVKAQSSNVKVAAEEFIHSLLYFARMIERFGSPCKLVVKESDAAVVFEYRFLRVPGDLQTSEDMDFLKASLSMQGLSLDSKQKAKRFLLSVSIPKAGREELPIEHMTGNNLGPNIWLESRSGILVAKTLKDDYRLSYGQLNAEQYMRHRPELWILDLHDFTLDQFDRYNRIRQEFPDLPVILMVPAFQKSLLLKFMRVANVDYWLTPILEEEVIIGVQKALNIEQPTTSQAVADVRELAVNVIRESLNLWQIYTGKSKAHLAESSKLWRVYMDGSTAKTRTLDKYLSLQTLPKKPRWETVLRTAGHVLEHCDLKEQDKQTLNCLVQQLNQQLAET